ncbi:ABC transporter permease [Maribacter hydrothermalis]|uniref:ABC transporter permease n=1 Tax=Maribacter hydrothermalis TaxID=1836467 RepID=A0A1B7Z3J2_9FLAO|nr:FtsX-like permease family protein [Maribacter hydrothermalis]APQ16983.1 ABC transporter permease [Maribacter hydrothermalis]OBR37244.1 ABC transporter permease [Maribacter hydrothermalis]
MLKNYIKIAWRNLLKNKQQTIINLLGLTLGTVSCLIILLYVFAQLGYDKHHNEAESIYRVETIIERNGQDGFDSATSSPPIAFALKEDFAEVEEATRVVLTDVFYSTLIRAANSTNAYYEPRVYMADSTFFKVFEFKFLEGDVKTALDEPNAVVLSSYLSDKLFGSKSPLGEAIIWGSGDDALTLTVKGVYDETAYKSHLNPNYIVSMGTPGMGTFVQNFPSFATNNFVYSYVKLTANSSGLGLQNKMPQFMEDRGAQDLKDAGMSNKRLELKKVTDIHLYSASRKNQLDRVSSSSYLYFLLSLAFFIQLVACINFINLSTARASKRAREIGVRKVVGAGKNALMRQFLGESLLLSIFAMLISIPIVFLLLPLVNDLTQESLSYVNLYQWQIVVILISIGVVTGLASGIYPAIVLSSIKPVKALKSSAILQSGSGTFRKVLVVFQFVVSISLVSTVIIIGQQFKYAQTKDLGYQKDNLLALRIGTEDASSKFESLKTSFLNVPGVLSVSSGNYAPSEIVLADNGFYLPGGNKESKTVVKRNGVSDGYFNTMGIELLKGRDFNVADTVDQIIVNEATLKVFNIDIEKALSVTLVQSYGDEIDELKIIGVVKDYHFASLKEEIQPLFLHKETEPNWLFIKVNTENYGQLLQSIEQQWKSTINNIPFDYRFVDKEIDKLYEEEKRLGLISVGFTILAIFISCLGLFGLISFVAEQKKKEIGVRKVLGASVQSVVKLLTKNFIKLVLIAFVVASPIAYYFISRWLEGFTYRIEIKWWVFLISGAFALMITILTVGLQSLKSAVVNPVKSLRSE